MEGTYPLLLDGARTGEVRVAAEGGWTVFDVQSECVTGVVRVSVYGAGREGYLGVLAPEGETLTLHRRLSRSDLRGFPAQIEYAGRAGQPQTPPQEEPAPEQPEPAPPAEAADETERKASGDEADLYWYATPDGALVSFDGKENRIALPAGDARIPTGGGGRAETIDGRDYVVFRSKNGRLLP